jgi:cation diffusion facilitator CzcD-associated flavoprotein CzcO
VGVIGTGTTAAQLVTAIAPRVGTLTVFQRTPSWILDVPNRRAFNWERVWLRRAPWLLRGINRIGTTLVASCYGGSFIGRSPVTRLYIEQRCRLSLRRVRDPELRRKLTPTYVPGCKRLVFTSGYYQAIQRSNVKLVTEAISRILPDGVISSTGELHALDLLILATGFQADAFMRPMTITGENGISIEQVWAAKPVAYRSVSIPHMPNFFMLVGPYTPIASTSVIEIAEWQIGYILRCIDIVRRQNVSLSATEAATEDYIRRLDKAARQTVWVTGCDSWYLGPDRLPNLYTRSPLHFRAELAGAPDLRDYDVRENSDYQA